MVTIQEAVSQARPTSYEIDPINVNRWSPRSFQEKEVPEETLFAVLEAAGFAPSAFNFQPWRFIVARTPEERANFLSFLAEFNQAWCAKVPVLILIVSQTSSENGPFPSAAFDAGAAWGALAHEAVRKGLVTHAMTGFDFEKARQVMNVPENFAIQAAVALGYQGDKDALPEMMASREAPSPRRPLEETVFKGAFGQPIK
ncbi:MULTISPECIES: nitroreductase family protein [Cohnella]|uniref:Nitroreductase family protein n=1 Tax=Cohnella phaseoli TaxID=456490 RepID=A0A3D9HQK8_9BACL|nr:nitroreductase family protein [Cohnella phaseoli]RED51814.1 nitroreductase family protein [Cohnella phaseoli]